MPAKKSLKEEKLQRHAYWQEQIERWKATGLTPSHYCRENNLSVHSFKYWQYQFAPETKRTKPLKVDKSSGRVAFKPVQILNDGPLMPTSGFSTAGLELIVNERLKLKIPSHFDEGLLRRVLHCLGVV